MVNLTRRSALKPFLAGLTAAGLPRMALAEITELTMAYNVNLPSWDPTTGPSAVNPTIQGSYKSVFDVFIAQKPDLIFAPGLLTKWGWTDDLSQIKMTVREGVIRHDGSDLTPEDVVWSLDRAALPATGNPMQFVWSKIGNFTIDGSTITGEVLGYDPMIFKWMSFLTGQCCPRRISKRSAPRASSRRQSAPAPIWSKGSSAIPCCG